MAKLTHQSLDSFRRELEENKGDWIKVGMSTCGIAAGADEVYRVINEEVQKRGLAVRVEKCGCAGMCYAEPLVEVCVEGVPRSVYGKVDKDTALKIVDKHVSGKRLVNDHVFNVKVK
ncbi:MAG: (2Fe-2S) ferredoxin domain-containing protein [Candidatus Omnitrophica bacterium]|nr:(2Fe-2S) ferredoxin domain-containing protein [Candidatus Omnitrophota bacterium]